MDSSISDVIWSGVLFVVLIFLSSIFSSFEMAITTITDYKYESYYRKKKKGLIYKINKKLIANYNMALSTILISNTLVNVGSSTLSTLFFTWLLQYLKIPNPISLATGIATGVVTLVVLFFGEMFPKTLARKKSMFFLKALGIFIYGLYIILFPINWILNKFIKPYNPRITEQEIDTLLDIVSEQNGIEQNEANLASHALKFDDINILSCMTKIKDIEYINLNNKSNKIYEKFISSEFSRLPVKNKNKWIGYLHFRDFIKNNKHWKDEIREIHCISQYSKLNDVLKEMQITKQHLFFVKKNNNSSSIVGMVTMESLLEKIVGEIYDEKDTHGDIAKINDIIWKVDPYVEIKEINQKLKLDINFDGSIFDYVKSISNDSKLKKNMVFKFEKFEIIVKKNKSKKLSFVIEKK